jgi:hypothetical protein
MANDGGSQGGPDNTAIQALLDKHKGDAMSLALQLFSENFQLRDKNRELKKQVPADGSVVLAKEDGQAFEAFKALNLKPDEIKSKLEAHETIATENAALKKKDTLRDIAQASGFKLSVLEDRDKASGGLEYSLKDEKDAKGSTRKVAYVKDGEKVVSLEQFAADKWTDYLPALKDAPGVPAKPGNGPDPAPRGGTSIFDSIRKSVADKQKQDQAGSPLKERFGLAKVG